MATLDAGTIDGGCRYLPINVTTGCYIRRTCAQCLQKSGCEINIYGVCETPDATTSTSEYDFHRAYSLNLTLPAMKTNNASALRIDQRYVFPAGEATYCAADDAVCKQCINERFWLPSGGFRVDSRYCVGANGCICILNCEFNEQQDGIGCVGPIPTTPAPTPKLDCLYYPADPVTGCKKLRSCRECLTLSGCQISSSGVCQDLDREYYNGYNYSHAIERNITLPVTKYTNLTALSDYQSWDFPSGKVKYCPVSDATCQQCIANRFWMQGGYAFDSRFCVGEDGCICVANCATTEQYACPTPAPIYEDEEAAAWRRFEHAMIAIFVVGLVLICMCLACCIRACHRCQQRKRQAREVPVATIVRTARDSEVLDVAVPYTQVQASAR